MAILLVCALSVSVVAQAPQSSQPASDRKWSRWFELQTATLTARYRFIEDSQGETANNQIQHQEIFRGRFKFDAAGHYSLNAGVASGNQFIGSWNNTGAGTGNATTNLYLKQLYVSARPFAGVEIQYGGLGLLRGESSEITTYDNDGYIVGERLSVKSPKRLFFDEIAVTYAYLGDTNTPDLNKRYHRLKQSNYHQFLASKKFGARVATSADYTFQAGTETLRQAVKLDLHEARLIDTLRFEDYERLDVHPAYGFALAGERHVTKRFTLTGGYSDIDRFYGGLNADRFNFGHRVFLLGSYALTPEFTVSTFYSHAVNKNYAASNRARFEVLFSYDLVKGLKRAGIL
ncbi:MAG TPA: hypothetical protein VE715_10660 [Blastocatellia bacterium]|nr:hypothetical protein [Blastocatellia bacterium]